jgi:hypothetical protein
MLTFIVAAVFVVALIGVAIIYFMMMFGGRCELQNAVDAGTLSVARRCLTQIFVRADQGSASFFNDVTNDKQEMNLENLNYCLAKSMLVCINQQAMAAQGESSDDSAKNSSDVFENTRRMSTLLDERLGEADKLKEFFYSVAQANSLRMLGKTELKVKTPIDRAYLDRGDKSSVYINSSELPTGFNAAELKPVTSGGKTWLPGYVPLDIGARGFNFVPQPIRPPHLIGERYFDMAKPSVHGTTITGDYLPVIGNGYRLQVSAGKAVASACGQADCVRDGFAMEMPHGFVRIVQKEPLYILKLHENLPSKYGGNWGKEKEYKPLVNDPIFLCYKAIKPKLDQLPSPWKVLHSPLYASQVEELKKKFEQRAKEILPGADLAKTDPPFASADLVEGDTTYGFRADNKFHLRGEQNFQDVLAMARWLSDVKDHPADGVPGNGDVVTITRFNYLFSLPCAKDVAVAARIQSIYFFQWVPSTGANSNLGELFMKRNVLVRFLMPKDQPSPQQFKDDPPL